MKIAHIMRRVGVAICWLGTVLCFPGAVVISLGMWLDGQGEDRQHRIRMGL